MTPLDVIDLDEILKVNSMGQKKIFNLWAKVSAILFWKL